MISFVHDVPAQRVVFAPGAVARVADKAARLGLTRALVIATSGSGARLGGRLVEILGARAAGVHAQASLHVPKPVAEAGGAGRRAAPPPPQGRSGGRESRPRAAPMASLPPAAAPPSGLPRSSRATSACRSS